MSYIKDNIMNLRKQVADTCNKIGRNTEDIQIIGVTKTIDSDRMSEAIQCGMTDVGENKVQEIINKYDIVSPVHWHMIGHLQTNKVKYIIDKVKLIHSLDRITLAKEINKRAKQHNLIIETLVQVNVAQEDTKFGLNCNEVNDFIDQVQEMENIKISGFMTIAPYVENPEDVRQYFKRLKSMFEEVKSKKMRGVEMKYLSMGMTNDFQIAIEEGSNMIRVGTGIFGKRNYSK
ncbi:YggS family pyridoxal phosphate-dependent enzyme [Clostridiaceae bacterium 35-E11]